MSPLIDFKRRKLVLIKSGSNYLVYICDLSVMETDCAEAWRGSNSGLV